MELCGILVSHGAVCCSDRQMLEPSQTLPLHTAVFRKLLPLAHTSNARIILVNRRDYPNSKPLSPEDTELLSRPDVSMGAENNQDAIEGFDIFMSDRAKEVLGFISELIDENLIIPKGKTGTGVFGGIEIIGWSGACSIAISLLANLEYFPSDMIEKLEPYMRSLVLYGTFYPMIYIDKNSDMTSADCSSNILLGYPNHPMHYFPMEDVSLTMEQRVAASARWLTGYYKHPALSVLDDQDTENGVELDELEFEFREPISFPLPTIQTINGEDLAINLAQSAVEVGKADLYSARAQLVGFAQLHRRKAFFESRKSRDSVENSSPYTGGNLKKDTWPGLETYFIWCDMSFAHAPLGALSLQNELNTARKKGEWTRDVTFVRFRGANHLVSDTSLRHCI